MNPSAIAPAIAGGVVQADPVGRRPPWLPPPRILEELPELGGEEVLAALQELGLDPDPDEIHRAYHAAHRMTPETAAVLGQLQLAARSGRWVEQRELAELAGGVDPATVCRVTQRLRRLHVLSVEGGRRYRDDTGRVRRRCLRYRLRWSPAIELRGHRVLQARIYRWARAADVGRGQVRRCIEAGEKGIAQLERLVRATRCSGEVRAPRPMPAPRERRSANQGPTGIGELVQSRLAQLRGDGGRSLVQHGAASSDRRGSGPKCSEGSGVLRGALRTTYRRGHVVTEPFVEPEGSEQLRRDVETEAARLEANSPRSSWRMVVNAARARGVDVPQAASLYMRCCAEARVGLREHRVRNAAGWAAGSFKRQLEAAA